MNKARIKILVLLHAFLLSVCVGVGLCQGHHGVSFSKYCYYGCTNLHSQLQCLSSSSSSSSLTLGSVSPLFFFSHPGRYLAVSHSGFTFP